MTADLAAPRIAMLSVHTSPREQPGTGDAGGMNVYVAQLARALAGHGAEVEIFTRATAPGAPDVEPLDAGDPRVLLHHVPAGPLAPVDKGDLPRHLEAFAAAAARRGGCGAGFDVVHSHYWLSGVAGIGLARHWDAPLVHTMHTLARVKDAQRAPGALLEPVERVRGEIRVARAADGIVASTCDESSTLVADYDVDPDAVHVVTPGVDHVTFRPGSRPRARAALGLADDDVVLVFAGRVQSLKGVDVLVEALARLGATPGGGAARLVVLGGPSGRADTVVDLLAQARRLGVAGRVRFEPAVAQSRLATWFQAADLVTVPSRSETFGFVAAEAHACGTPVVAAAVGGLRHIVVDGVTGRLVPGHDPQRWAAELAELLADPARRAEMAGAAQQRSRRFSWDAAALEVLKAYALAALRRESRVAA